MKSKILRVLAGFTLLSFLALNNGFAPSITINTNNKVEFGQGSVIAVRCDSAIQVSLASRMDPATGEFWVSSVTLSDLSLQLHDRTLDIGLRDQNGNKLNSSLKVSVASSGISFSSNRAISFLIDSASQGSGAGGEIGANRVTFTNFYNEEATRIASDSVKRVTLEVSGSGTCSYPTVSYTTPVSSVNFSSNRWVSLATPANADYLYIADSDTGLATGKVYRSSTFANTLTGLTLTPISALPTIPSGQAWTAVSVSATGKYVIVTGTNNRAFFSTDFGSTWTNQNTSNYNSGANASGRNASTSISDDGSVVCLIAGGNRVNIWRRGDFFTNDSKTASYTDANNFWGCEVSPDGTRVFIASSTNLYRFTTSALPTGSNLTLPAANLIASGTIRGVTSSNDGKHIAYLIQPPGAYVSHDYGATFTQARGVPTQQKIGATTHTLFQNKIAISNDGRLLALTLYATGADAGGIFTSFDSGATFSATSYVNRYAGDLAHSSDLSKLFSLNFLSQSFLYMIRAD